MTKVLAHKGTGTNTTGRCIHCSKSVILVKFMNYPSTWFHTHTGFKACAGGTEAEVAEIPDDED